MFIEAVTEVKVAKIKSFYRPIYDPSDERDHMVAYKKGKKPAVDHSYNWWVETAEKMPTVESRPWHLATEYQYYAFLVWLINQLVQAGKSVGEVLEQVVIDSKELGHYCNSEHSTNAERFEQTGSRYICGVFDLVNTNKILACSDEKAGGFWFAGGNCRNFGFNAPLAELEYYTNVDGNHLSGVGMLVLE